MPEAAVPAFMQGRGTGPHSFFFDFDGTLFPGESLEEVLALALADDPNREERVHALEALGRRGMEGSLEFSDSLRGRLDIARPHRRHVEAWLAEARNRLLPLWAGLLGELRSVGHRVVVVSGGFRDCIVPLVGTLGIDAADVHCNDFTFGDDGWVTGLDEDQPLSRSGGKPWTVRTLVSQGGLPGLRIMIGDGATDLEAVSAGACHGMIGYGVHVIRPAVRNNADIFFDQAKDFDQFLRAQFL